MELNSNHSEPKKMKINKIINSYEIKFIIENEWLNDFFDQQNNIEYIKGFINKLNHDDFTILYDRKSVYNVKIKLIVDWLNKKNLTINLNEHLNFNDTKTENLNIFIKVDSKIILINYEENFIKVILHIFEQNQENFEFSNFEFPRAVKLMDFYYDEKMILHAFTKIWNVFYTKKILNILK
ncbi:hypothetical protein GVAV_000484 [Gurleya vavrai]